MIRFEQVTKRYPGGHTALERVDIDIARGEMVVVTGHSGAGKSTLLKLLAVLERPTEGRVLVGGENVSALKRAALPYWRRSIGLIMQDQRLLFDRSAFDNVMLPLSISSHPPREAAKRVSAALERVGLAGREKAMPVELSGGEQQRLTIARAIVNRPQILLADEPTAHLDDAYARDIADLFRSFNEAGVTVLLTTHDGGLFERYAPRRLSLAHGTLQ
ncbi:MAG: ATP-binding cassette domain-containing protein [Methyloversatilis sp.]|jgi:cell division transport system ATP-binding protein|uniref:Cell division ATP-binding protein FtsE n=1 Tax=Methyloversatilis universalis (strain ATCC BAA-1314 / DSM 25237 / JCM 13912 / CCUG 52030 / FAM5) TaxID=1000565 RepID=F5RHJ9_METUF|nr:ATP-binding cassette domain-containing protein [Methyloversatilis universalis]EGK69831.1 Cell division ATP-binding protein FtsE [Methyloversatilis universalis FAM5]MCP4637707.1 ATP-binding cassette domain-containing protein [Methyloversatilis sp.]